MKLVITRDAQKDIKSIWDYISQNSDYAADNFIEKIHSECESIAALEFTGRKRDEIKEGLWSLAYGNYVIFFKKGMSLVEIVRIIHGARDIKKVF